MLDFYNNGLQALKTGTPLSAIRAMSVISLLLKARMNIKDDEIPKLDDLHQTMIQQFKQASEVKTS